MQNIYPCTDLNKNRHNLFAFVSANAKAPSKFRQDFRYKPDTDTACVPEVMDKYYYRLFQIEKI